MLLTAVTALTACGEDDGTGPGANVAAVNVTAPSQTLAAIDGTVQLQAAAFDSDGDPVAGVSFTWTSSAPGVASVDAGLVTAVSNGDASITATAGGASGSIDISVEQVATGLAFAAPPTNNSVDVPFPQLAVEARDANGHVAANFTEAVTISIGANPLGGGLTGQFTRDAAGGMATFSGLAIDTAGAGYTLVATSGALSVESDPFNVTLPSAYVGRFGSGFISVIDLRDNSLVDQISVVSGSPGIALSPDGLFAYAARREADDVAIIETPGNTIVTSVPVGDEPWLLAMSPDGATVYVSNRFDNTVSVIETASNTVSGAIDVGGEPAGLCFTPDGELVYVANSGDGTVSVIQTATETVIATVTVGNAPAGAAITPDGSLVYVANALSGTASVIATSSNTVVATITVGDNALMPVITPDGADVLVPNLEDHTVSRIETASNTVTATIPVQSPWGVAVTRDGQLAYVTNFTDGTASVIDLATNTVTETIQLGGGDPAGIAIMPAPVP